MKDHQVVTILQKFWAVMLLASCVFTTGSAWAQLKPGIVVEKVEKTAWMFVLLTLALLASFQPNQHGATPRSIAEEDFWDSYQWRVAYEDWRREHPGAARMLDQFDLPITPGHLRRLVGTAAVDYDDPLRPHELRQRSLDIGRLIAGNRCRSRYQPRW